MAAITPFKSPISMPKSFFSMAAHQHHQLILITKIYSIKHIINHPAGDPIPALKNEIATLSLRDFETPIVFNGRLRSTFDHIDAVCQDLRVCDFLVDLHWHVYMLELRTTQPQLVS